MIFRNREEAGKLLGNHLKELNLKKPIIFGIPRGGVVIGYEISKILNCPLDTICVSKIPSYINEEYAIGAISEDGTILLREKEPEEILKKTIERKKKILEERVRLFRNGEPIKELKGHTAIIVDDGIATGETMLIAVRTIKNKNPDKVVVAVPVSSIDAKERIEKEVDLFISLYLPTIFYAVGQFYEDFEQVDDNYVINILEERRKDERV
ncbi:MAG: phosphoribosyltransferase family protein [Caldisericia bacterium]|nr:phosphoribosyltransferase family protein [Caldisericia bacterium]